MYGLSNGKRQGCVIVRFANLARIVNELFHKSVIGSILPRFEEGYETDVNVSY